MRFLVPPQLRVKRLIGFQKHCLHLPTVKTVRPQLFLAEGNRRKQYQEFFNRF